ncbi:iron-binding CDGSH zinc finger protein [Alkalibaculum bacchi]|uniref:Iron-binding CDGSH zinc finger protein n=1 Tax=Alkalibaculum bacchi TaxID=645887 RepID=A0A366I831_9FIRM|nr:CDGSH iron-sulfur domain-containing protein [Alkalibaculum bacchi]RBP63824.1 iron-binding CDGSH zinc finger protein [Alkalibaculum bacchi]
MKIEKPVIAGKALIPVDVKKGETYYYCACGKSGKQPFCDGSHEGTSFEPLAFTAEKDDTVYLCACKQTKNPPYCDGSHEKL